MSTKPALASAIVVLVVLLGVPFAAAVVVSMGAGAAAKCPPHPSTQGDSAASDGSVSAATPSVVECSPIPAGAGVTLATLNLLGAGHTDDQSAGGATKNGFPAWRQRLDGAMTALRSAGASIAALQEVHPPQAHALTRNYASEWSIFPSEGSTQNRVVWDTNLWTLTTGQLVPIPYFGGTEVGTPLVHLTSTTTGQTIWVWSIHNPADTRGPAGHLRSEALRRQHDTVASLAATGTAVVIAGDFNDARDGARASHCRLTPTLTNAFGGSAEPCTAPTDDAAVDHIYGANVRWAAAHVDASVQSRRISDHPLVVATTATESTVCTYAPADGDPDLGPAPEPSTATAPLPTAAQDCPEVVYPVSDQYAGTDRHNWHASGESWASWHTGTDFSVPCGTAVYAAHAGTIEIDTTQPWAGPHLVKVATGPTSLATWYAHLQTVAVSRGQAVSAGDVLGIAGNLGNARGCHLHFEVHLRNGSIYGADNVDPSAWLATQVDLGDRSRARGDIGEPEAYNHAA